MVVCPNCQQESRERFFCDRCYTLLPSSTPGLLPTQVLLPDGRMLDCTILGAYFPADCWRVWETVLADKPHRVYALNRNWWQELGRLVEARARQQIEVLAPVDIVPLTEGAIVVARGLEQAARPLLSVVEEEDPLARVESALRACRLLQRALEPLHQAGLVWLNFDPSMLLVSGEQMQIQNLDLLSCPFGSRPAHLPVSAQYSVPEVSRHQERRIGPATDVFHVALYAYYALAELLPRGFPGNGPEAFDFDIPPLRIYASKLPIGIAPVIEKALSREPSDRYASISAFVEAFADAVTGASSRAKSRELLHLQAGGATAIGEVHALLGLPNQDAFAVRREEDCLLALVADGVTHCQIGSGERASQITSEKLCQSLEPLLGRLESREEVHQAVERACLEASRAILDEALVGQSEQWVDPMEVMSSTLVLALIRGNELTVACAGDSRVYLVTQEQVEQLTVDGDVRCVQLAAGWPPEEIQDLGYEGQSLYHCLGIGVRLPEGKVIPCPDRSTPRIRHWNLQPGDLLVLCSDGLVEEGTFLEPGDLVRLASDYHDAQELANVLVAEAKSRHRPPSRIEPEGRGDDVTCVVIRVTSASRDAGFRRDDD